jgi:hypothetical protein
VPSGEEAADMCRKKEALAASEEKANQLRTAGRRMRRGFTGSHG